MNENVAYVGKDLEAMSFAENYHRWILEIFGPYLGKSIVEVGAGTGAMSELLLEREVESLVLVEPSGDMHRLLQEWVGRVNSPAKVTTYNDIFANIAERIRDKAAPDSVIYVNVLEHVEDDDAELQTVQRILPTGGRVFIFVPALAWLYGSLDRQIGHYRRYTKSELEDKCRRAGMRIIKSGYFDSLGIVPWWIKYRLLKSTRMESGAVRFYDRIVVPVIKLAESTVTPPLGKNVFLIAEKSG